MPLGIIWNGGHFFTRFQGFLNINPAKYIERLQQALGARACAPAWRRMSFLHGQASYHRTQAVRTRDWFAAQAVRTRDWFADRDIDLIENAVHSLHS
ncbi:MAG: hypothetical protein P4L99_22760 [Chthoniobacter sp.]|nr:hypothetical protein [Chthoniobacter sp.]